MCTCIVLGCGNVISQHGHALLRSSRSVYVGCKDLCSSNDGQVQTQGRQHAACLHVCTLWCTYPSVKHFQTYKYVRVQKTYIRIYTNKCAWITKHVQTYKYVCVEKTHIRIDTNTCAWIQKTCANIQIRVRRYKYMRVAQLKIHAQTYKYVRVDKTYMRKHTNTCAWIKHTCAWMDLLSWRGLWKKTKARTRMLSLCTGACLCVLVYVRLGRFLETIIHACLKQSYMLHSITNHVSFLDIPFWAREYLSITTNLLKSCQVTVTLTLHNPDCVHDSVHLRVSASTYECVHACICRYACSHATCEISTCYTYARTYLLTYQYTWTYIFRRLETEQSARNTNRQHTVILCWVVVKLLLYYAELIPLNVSCERQYFVLGYNHTQCKIARTFEL